jgi:hypothetical protein
MVQHAQHTCTKVGMRASSSKRSIRDSAACCALDIASWDTAIKKSCKEWKASHIYLQQLQMFTFLLKFTLCCALIDLDKDPCALVYNA